MAPAQAVNITKGERMKEPRIKLKAKREFSNVHVGDIKGGQVFECPAWMQFHFVHQAKVADEIPGETYHAKIVQETHQKKSTDSGGSEGGKAKPSLSSGADPASPADNSKSSSEKPKPEESKPSPSTPASSTPHGATSSTPATAPGGSTYPKDASSKRGKKWSDKLKPKRGRKT